MPMELRTGFPGTFKSCGAVEQLIEWAEDDAYKDRPRYQLGITGLRPDLAEPITVEQFKDWKSLPVGSIVVVDEAQKVMPARRSGDAPQFIRDMSEHRHRGITFVFITQKPAMLDKYVRDLVDVHLHHVRKYGSMWAERWRFAECMDEPTTKSAKRQSEGKDFVKASPEAMEAYVSAQMHTIQRRTPKFIKVAVLLALAIPVACWFGYHSIVKASGQPDHTEASAKPSAAPVAAPTGQKPQAREQEGRSHKVMTTSEWVARFEPRVPGMPWSAPAYDDRPVQGTPELYCVIMGVGEVTEHCRCNTEQGTRASVPDNMCRTMAREGTYNPYRKPREAPQPKGTGREPGLDPEAVDVASATLPAVQRVRYAGGVGAPVVQAEKRSSAANVGTAYTRPDQTTVGAVD
jgi:zona occludens toxin